MCILTYTSSSPKQKEREKGGKKWWSLDPSGNLMAPRPIGSPKFEVCHVLYIRGVNALLEVPTRLRRAWGSSSTFKKLMDNTHQVSMKYLMVCTLGGHESPLASAHLLKGVQFIIHCDMKIPMNIRGLSETYSWHISVSYILLLFQFYFYFLENQLEIPCGLECTITMCDTSNVTTCAKHSFDGRQKKIEHGWTNNMHHATFNYTKCGI